MTDFWMRLLGVRVGDASRVVGMEWEVRPVMAVGWLVVLVLAAVALAVWSYRRTEGLSQGRRGLLMGLRVVVLLALVGVFWRPGLALVVEGQVRQSLVLLFDVSASMNLRDPRTEPADQVRAAMLDGRLPVEGGLEQALPVGEFTRPTRTESVQAMLTRPEWDVMGRLGASFDLAAAGFDGDWVALEMPGEAGGETGMAPEDAMKGGKVRGSDRWTGSALAGALTSEGWETAPGTAMREVMERFRGRPLAGMVLVTDGIQNAGLDAREAARRAREAGLTVQVVGVGTTAPRDVQVADVEVAEVAFAQDELPIRVRVRARGGLESQPLEVVLLGDGVERDRREVVLGPEGEGWVDLRWTPEAAGDFEIAVSVPARADEILTENNAAYRRVRVIDDRVRVLFLEQSPRWEFRYLQALLLRDRRVDLKCILFDGDPAIARWPDTPYLDSFPSRREELFGYDLVIFGDVDPRNFTSTQIEMLAEFVSRAGGSLLMVAGRRFGGAAYRGTALEGVLPVELERESVVVGGMDVADRPVRLELTAAGRASPLLRGADDPEENQRRWESLPPIFWVAPVGRAKPAAEVLVVEAREGDDPMPVMVRQAYGSGQSMWVGTDNLWRWRRNEGEQFYSAFWSRVVQRLAVHHRLGGSRRTQVLLDRSRVVPGERVGVTVRLSTSSFEPATEPAARLQVERVSEGGAGEEITEALLRWVPDQPGMYRGEVVASAPGRYRVWAGDDAPASADLTVEARRIEEGETAMAEAGLREVAALGGGEFFREENLHRLPASLESQVQRIQSRASVEAWSSPFYFLMVLVVLASEWVLRKWWQLK
jgi:uncharacterized membrane protein